MESIFEECGGHPTPHPRDMMSYASQQVSGAHEHNVGRFVWNKQRWIHVQALILSSRFKFCQDAPARRRVCKQPRPPCPMNPDSPPPWQGIGLHELLPRDESFLRNYKKPLFCRGTFSLEVGSLFVPVFTSGIAHPEFKPYRIIRAQTADSSPPEANKSSLRL